MNQQDTPVILITGAARRVGAEIARTLHAAGAHVVLHYRQSAADAEALAAALNAQRRDSATTVRADLKEDGAPEGVVDTILARHGRLDALVNNASSFYPTPLGRIDAAAWTDLIGSNLKGPLFLSQAAAPALRECRGAIVNIVDIHAERPMKNYPVYCVAKAGLAGLTRALALELGPEVRVNGVSPGAIDWPEDGQFPADERDAIVRHTLLGRIGSPTDIARTVRFLIFDAPYITGQILAVDGGRSAHL
ncbi:pteridine reductase [Azoarcus sp. KH32C]|uniref:pteridine reductase n=1 Tax=Azoarcus sp. KH32C TaxID=748247 RepID=UPI0002386E29|nr:pteridine reductase [Azoarcus sp. KH32C]BAL26616.1 pteridine reductase [Azoarcus sp. KH32C]